MTAQKNAPVAPRRLNVADFELQPRTSLIEASAGTGKTFTIQYCVLDLLFKGLRLPEILIVTFTEAATKELSDRLQAFLAQVHGMLLTGASGDTQTQAVLKRALDRQGEAALRRILSRALLEIDQAAIYTIHGFCQRALQENAFAADANFDFELCTDLCPVVESCVMDFLRCAQLEMCLPPPGIAKKKDLTERGLKLANKLRIKEPHLGGLKSVGAELTPKIRAIQAYGDEAESIVAEFKSFQGKLRANKYKSKIFEDFPSILKAVLVDPLAADLNKLRKDEIQSAFKKEFKATEFKSGFFQACEELDVSKGTLEPDFLRCFDTWFIEAIQRIKSERAIMTYDDMVLDLERALKQSRPLQAQLRERYRAALVDEFQDTDDRQYQIFHRLFGTAETGDRYFAMIGDPKQSIYEFRGADIRAYLEAREAAAHRYTLPVNYRSERSVVEATNAFFKNADLGAVLKQSGAESIPFSPVEAADQTKERLVFSGEGVVSALYERAIKLPDDGKAKTAHRQSVALAAGDIQRLLDFSAQGKVYFEAADSGARRAINPGDIAVLVDTHKDASEVQKALQALGIVAVRSKAGKLVKTDEAKIFLYFLMACLDPRERVINRLLASSLFGKTAKTMLEMPDTERGEIYERFTLLGKQWREGAAVSLIWMQLLDHLDVRERLLAEVGGERMLTNYLHMAEFAQELERRERLSPERLCDRLIEVIEIENAVPSGDSEKEYLVRLESDARAVRIMTMHSAKGLEFPVVFLPSLWQRGISKAAKEEARLQCVADDPDCYIGLAADKEAVLRAASAENLRLGYVALTRAVHFTVYYNVRGLESQHPSSAQANGWFDQWVCEQRGGGYPTEAHEDFLEILSEAPAVSLERPDEAIEPQPRELRREISLAYQITSYSALARTGQNLPEPADPSRRSGMGDQPIEAHDVKSSVDASSVEPDLLLESFPSGVRTGTCIHELLERSDFTHPESWERIARAAIDRHFPDGGVAALDRRVNETLTLLRVLIARPKTGANGATLDLAALAPRACIHEMEFYFPVDQVDVSDLEAVLQSWGERVGLAYTPVRYHSREIVGFLTGSVDLFFKQDGRFYILDWKTNGPLREQAPLRQSYDRAGMHAHMVHGRYYLQALIYTVAVAAYLRARLGARFNWADHIGGFIYCFVRGLDHGSGWLHESFSQDEVRQAGRALGLQAFPKGGL